MSIPDTAPPRIADNPVAVFLLTVYPLIRILHGEKRTALRKQWIATANWSAAGLLGNRQRDLPRSPDAAFRMLFTSCLELADQLNIPRAELVEAFNMRAESGVRGIVGRADESVDQCFSALLVLLMERQKAVVAVEEPEARTA